MDFWKIAKGLLYFLAMAGCGDINFQKEPDTYCEKDEGVTCGKIAAVDGVCPAGYFRVRKNRIEISECPVAL